MKSIVTSPLFCVTAAAFALACMIVVPLWPQISAYVEAQGVAFHGFDLALWQRQSPVIQAHVLGAGAALAIGLVIFAQRKGSPFHKVLGWAWVIAMALTAATSLFITGLNGDSYSLIHGLTAFTLLMLPLGVLAIRRKDVRRHRRIMTGLFLGGLIVAGLFTFVPGRLMWNLFFGA